MAALLVIVFLLIIECVLGGIWGTGAPCSAQHSLKPAGSRDNAEPSPFMFSVHNSTGHQVDMYRPGEIYTIRLFGISQHMVAFLIQARLATRDRHIIGHLRAGDFIYNPNWSRYGIQAQNCPPNGNNSLTNSNDVARFIVDASWTVGVNVGPVQFFITVIQDDDTMWTRWAPETGFLLPDKNAPSSNRSDNHPINFLLPSIIQPAALSTTTTKSTNDSSDPFEFADQWTADPGNTTTTTTITKITSTTTTTRKPKPIEKKEKISVLDPQTGRFVTYVEEPIRNNDQQCSSNYCANNGTCRVDTTNVQTYCDCAPGFMGELCELIDHCVGNDCRHGATCTSTVDSYQCRCASEWGGEHCDQRCPSYLCENGGRCMIRDRGYSYGCDCTGTGWHGPKCQYELNDCASNPCQNGGICTDKHDGYECTCAKGYMGKQCHRPCQDIYQSCTRWKQEDRCVAMRGVTRFFDINCAVTCEQCQPLIARVAISLPPVLEPLVHLIGRWESHASVAQHYPIDFQHTNGYTEVWQFTVANVLMFGTPFINFTSTARSDRNPNDVHSSVGFLTLNSRHPKDKPYQISLTSIGNSGLTLIEEGTLLNNTLVLRIKYNKSYEQRQRYNNKLTSTQPPLSKRIIQLVGDNELVETVSKVTANGITSTYTKQFRRTETYEPY